MRVNYFRLNGPIEWPFQQSLFFPKGLIAFEAYKKFSLFANQEELPFFWLESEENPLLAFVVIDPRSSFPDYKPSISDEVFQHLKLQNNKDYLLLTIVHIEGSLMHVNLAAPLLVDWDSKEAYQILVHDQPTSSRLYPKN